MFVFRLKEKKNFISFLHISYLKCLIHAPVMYNINLYIIWKLGELQEKPIIRLTCSLSYYEGYNIYFIIVISEFND